MQKSPATAAAKPINFRNAPLFIALMLIVPLIGCAILALQFPQLERDAYDELQIVARYKANDIERWLHQRLADAQVLADSADVAEHAIQLQQHDASSTQDRVRTRLEAVRHAYGYDAVLLLDRQGKTLSSVGETVHPPPATQRLIDKALDSRQVQLSDIVREPDGNMHLDFVAPLRHRTAQGTQIAGFVILHIDPQRSLFPMVAAWPTASPSAEAFLVRRVGDTIEYLSELRHRNSPPLQTVEIASDPTLPAVVAVQNRDSGIILSRDYRGVEVFAAYHPIADTDWRLVVKIDRAEVMTPFWRSLTKITLISLAADLILGAVLLALWRQQRRTTQLELAAQAATLSAQREEERKRLETQLKDSEQRYRTLVESTPDLITRVDRQGRFTFVNHSVEHYFGIAAQECIGLSAFDFIHPDDRAMTMTAFDAWLKSADEVLKFENRQLGRHGDAYLMQWNIVVERTDDGSIVGFDSFARDITHEHAQEAALKANATMLDHILSLSLDGFWLIDTHGKLLDVNPSYVRQSGYSRAELLTMHVTDLEVQESPDEVAQHIRRIAEIGNDEFETRHCRKDGSIWHVEISVGYRDSDGGQFFAFIRDISERKRLVQELTNHHSHLEALVKQRTLDLENALAAAKLADSAKDRFLANVSHELRTPLNAIIGLSGLAWQLSTETRLRDYLHKIAAAGKTLARVINDLLDLSKIAAGHMELDATTFSLKRLLQHCISLMSFKLTEKNLPLIERIADNVPDALIGDPLRIEQILTNLLNNAIKFTHSGRIELRISRGAEAEDGSKIALSIEIEDTGIGMSAEDIARLFVPFSQADASMSRKYGGTGLGLALCKHLAQMMDGDIDVHSRPGGGTTFRVELRLGVGETENLPVDDAPAANASALRYEGARVLAVDDQPLNREVVDELLKSIGIASHLACNGCEALELLAIKGPGYYDLVLMDIQMPVMDGLQATGNIRRQPGFESLPVIAMTAHTMEHERQISLAAGMNDHIGKPFETETFYRVLSKWLPAAKLRATAPSATPPTADASPAAEELKLENIDTQAGLSRFAGNRQRYYHWLEKFVVDAPTHTTDIRRLLAMHEIDQARQAAHAIKGKVGLLGMKRLHEIVSALEAAIRQGEPTGDLLDRMHLNIAELCTEIKAKLPGEDA